MLLAIDIGNTNIVVGAFDGEHLRANWRVATDASQTADEYAVLLSGLLAFAGLSMRDMSAVCLASVVPALSTTFEELSTRYCDVAPIVVGPGIRSGVKILYENPREVGADRIANAVATYHLYGGPAIVIDFGTATTFDALSADGEYLGGAIAPGLTIAAEALFRNAARLYRVELKRPKGVIGRNTGASVQSGLIYGYVGLIEGLVERFKSEMGPARVIATGGLSEVIAAESPSVEIINPLLTLEGLRLIYDLNRELADVKPAPARPAG